jgi:hypothetical protein
METIKSLSLQEKMPASLPTCPACGGVLILLRGFYRCSRCCYSVCESCETGAEEDEP